MGEGAVESNGMAQELRMSVGCAAMATITVTSFRSTISGCAICIRKSGSQRSLEGDEARGVGLDANKGASFYVMRGLCHSGATRSAIYARAHPIWRRPMNSDGYERAKRRKG